MVAAAVVIAAAAMLYTGPATGPRREAMIGPVPANGVPERVQVSMLCHELLHQHSERSEHRRRHPVPNLCFRSCFALPSARAPLNPPPLIPLLTLAISVSPEGHLRRLGVGPGHHGDGLTGHHRGAVRACMRPPHPPPPPQPPQPRSQPQPPHHHTHHHTNPPAHQHQHTNTHQHTTTPPHHTITTPPHHHTTTPPPPPTQRSAGNRTARKRLATAGRIQPDCSRRSRCACAAYHCHRDALLFPACRRRPQRPSCNCPPPPRPAVFLTWA